MLKYYHLITITFKQYQLVKITFNFFGQKLCYIWCRDKKINELCEYFANRIGRKKKELRWIYENTTFQYDNTANELKLNDKIEIMVLNEKAGG